MSLGTRKKFVDFHKILFDGASIDSNYQNNMEKSGKKQIDKIKKKNLKDKKFLGKKRDSIKLSKSNKNGKLHDSAKKYENRTINKNSEKSIKYPKSHILKNNEKNIASNESNQRISNSNTNKDNQPIKINTDSNSNRNQKNLIKNDKLDKDEFCFLLNNNKEEYNHLGIDINPIINSIDKGNFNSINSDFTTLTLDLFSSTKFENSKPFKMIDYILNSDSKYLTSSNDKETYEEIKKTIYNKKSNATDNSQILFKSLYQYFKTDFSFSYIYKIFDSCNELIEKFYNPELYSNNPGDSFGGFFFDKKDKFTYQNYLVDKLKNNYNNEWMKEIYDKEMIKSLIYLCNKHMKQSFKILNGNSENNFVRVLKDNLKFLEECEKEMNKGDNLLANATFKKIKKKLMDDKEFTRLFKKKLKRLFAFKNFSHPEEKDTEDIKRIFNKLLELFIKLKEDDYEKILNKFKKFDKELEKDKETKETSSDDLYKNVKSFWIRFKIIFYLITLGDKNIKSYITDELFWRLIIDYVNEVKIKAQQEAKPVEPIINNTLKARKGRKKIVKESTQETPKKQNIDDGIDNIPQDTSKIIILNSIEKNSNLKHTNEENQSITNQIENENNKNNTFASEMKAYEFIESEFNKSILSKIEKREKIFEILKEKSQEIKTRKKKRVVINESVASGKEEFIERSENETISVKEENVIDNKDEEIVIKPKTVRLIPGFNPNSGNILINNLYNLMNNHPDAQSLAFVQNFSHEFENEKITFNADEKKEKVAQNENIPVIKRKKGRPKKLETKVVQVQPEQSPQEDII